MSAARERLLLPPPDDVRYADTCRRPPASEAARPPVNTARIASLCLPSPRSGRFSAPRRARAIRPSEAGGAPLPGPGAVDVELLPPPTDITLAVVDGTWSQARKLIGLNPALAALPRYAFRPPRPSEYRIRKEPQAHYVSTLEALYSCPRRARRRSRPLLCRCSALPRDGRSADCVRDVRARAVGGFATPESASPPTHETGSRPRFASVLPILVCVHAEANAWPYGVVERATCPEELVQWVATRPATGESFEALVAPRHLLCSKTPWHLGIDVAEILRGMTPGELGERWARFLRPGDVVCAWGTHPLALFEGVGGVLPAARVDLRRAARSYSNVLAGTMDASAIASASTLRRPAGQGGRACASRRSRPSRRSSRPDRRTVHRENSEKTAGEEEENERDLTSPFSPFLLSSLCSVRLVIDDVPLG